MPTNYKKSTETIVGSTRGSEELQIGFVGNPNSGKTTLFNAYTGARLKVANWPGVTVEKKEGAFKYHNHIYKLVDLPGIYSLTSYSIEEKISRQYILSDNVDVIIDVVDASNLERNLYLTLQLIETGKPVVMALNMMDIVEERGMEIDLHRLPELLQIPIIPVSAKKKTGFDILMHAASHHSEVDVDNRVVIYSDLLEEKIAALKKRLIEHDPDLYNPRFYAIKLLENDPDIMEECPVDVSDIVDRSYETELINQKYDFIEDVIEEVLVRRQKRVEITDKVDSVLTHRIWGVPIFLGVMALVFFLTFTLGDGLKEILEGWLEQFSDWSAGALLSAQANPILSSLIVDGIIPGVGTILEFLPNIAILFLALAFLEDSGYMARVAYVMNGIMNKIGLSGRAFIPMLLGFGCTVPAIMATRTLENQRDRRKAILITPFMSCSAKIPIYVMLSGMFFGRWASLAALSMYIIGLFAGLFTAYIATKIENRVDRSAALKKTNESYHLLIELPEYKSPNANSIAIYVWENTKAYVMKAGTTIFLASVLLWFILNFGVTGFTEDMSLSFGGGFRTTCRSAAEAGGSGLLADRRRADRRLGRQGSRGVQPGHLVRHRRHGVGRGAERHAAVIRRDGLWTLERLFVDDLCAVLHALSGRVDRRRQGVKINQMDRVYFLLSNFTGVGGVGAGLPDRQFVYLKVKMNRTLELRPSWP